MNEKTANLRDKIIFGAERDWNTASGGILHFDGLYIEALEKLVEKKLIHLDGAQNSSPRVRDFANFLKKYPKAYAHGYVVRKERSDTRVSLEGIGCHPEHVTEQMKKEFTALCKRADEFRVSGALFAWWD